MDITDPVWLKAELTKPGRSQAALARHLGIASSGVNRLVNGARDLKAREIETIREYLEASDSILARRVQERMDAVGTNPNRLSAAIGSRDVVRMLLSGRAKMPRADTLASLARELECDPAYLLGQTDAVGGPPEALDTPGSRLRLARQRAGLTAAELGERVGRAVSAVRNQENGTNGIPAALAQTYAEILGTSPEWILFGEGAAPTAGRYDATPPPSLRVTALPNGEAKLELSRVLPMATALQILQMIEGAPASPSTTSSPATTPATGPSPA